MNAMNLANILTILRIVLVVPIILLLSFPSAITCWLAELVFICAALTDYFDGHIARKSNLVSNFGKFMDPLADKILICSVFIMLVELSRIPAWIVIVIMCREFAVTGLRGIAMNDGVVIAADKFGKAKTVMQICALIPLIIDAPLFGVIPLHEIGMLC